jgi:hypothetical protein
MYFGPKSGGVFSMNSNRIINQFPYLRSQRKFPLDDRELIIELDRSYVDIANAVNTRSISLFTTNRPTNTGQSWYFQGLNEKKQSLRQVYEFVSAGNIAHGIPNTEYLYFSRCFGFFTDGTNFYAVPFSSNNVPIAGQITFYIDPTNIVVLAGAGALVPTIGYIVLEWLTKN